jgi:hypothetical protein
LLIVSAEREADIIHDLGHDPWACTEWLQITNIEPWNLLVGAERLSGVPARIGAPT